MKSIIPVTLALVSAFLLWRVLPTQKTAEQVAAPYPMPSGGYPDCLSSLAPVFGDASSALSHSGKMRAESLNEDSGGWVVVTRISDGSVVRKAKAPPSQLEDIGDSTPVHQPRFSLDDRKVYFIQSWATTSGYVDELDIATGNIRKVIAGNKVMVVPYGEYAGKLIVYQHKYFAGPGSYDWYWLVDPNAGKVVDNPIGDEYGDFLDLYACPH